MVEEILEDREIRVMSEKLKVGILGGTGMVGQRFISLLENHPWFEVTTIAASPRSAGKTYEDAIGDRWKMDTPMPEAVKKIIVKNVNEVEEVASQVDFVFSAVDMSKDEIKKIEEDYAKTETPVVSNNSAHRWTPDVPMVVPEINPQHMEVIKYQKERLGTKRGFVAVSQTAQSSHMLRFLQHGKSLSHMRLLLQHIRQSQVPERHSRTGLRWLETSFHSSVERKRNLRKSHFVSGDMWMMRRNRLFLQSHRLSHASVSVFLY